MKPTKCPEREKNEVRKAKKKGRRESNISRGEWVKVHFVLYSQGKNAFRRFLVACVQTSPLPLGKIRRGDVCESPSLIVFQYTFA